MPVVGYIQVTKVLSHAEKKTISFQIQSSPRSKSPKFTLWIQRLFLNLLTAWLVFQDMEKHGRVMSINFCKLQGETGKLKSICKQSSASVSLVEHMTGRYDNQTTVSQHKYWQANLHKHFLPLSFDQFKLKLFNKQYFMLGLTANEEPCHM